MLTLHCQECVVLTVVCILYCTHSSIWQTVQSKEWVVYKTQIMFYRVNSTLHWTHCSLFSSHGSLYCKHCSAKNEMNRRYSKHKSDIRKKIWQACGLSRHFERHHQGNMEEAISNMRVTLLDHLPGPYHEGRLLELEQSWMYKLGSYERTGCNSRLELTNRRRVNYGNS